MARKKMFTPESDPREELLRDGPTICDEQYGRRRQRLDDGFGGRDGGCHMSTRPARGEQDPHGRASTSPSRTSVALFMRLLFAL